MRRWLIPGAFLLGVWTGCAAPRPSPDQAYEQGKKAGAAAYIPPPSTAAERQDPSRYYRALMTDVRSSPERYYYGSAWHWESGNFRQGFLDSYTKALEARAGESEIAARGTVDDYALGKKMAADLGALLPDVDFKSMPERCRKEPGGLRVNLALNAQASYRTAYVEAKGAKRWDLQPEQFRSGFAEGYFELCGAARVEREVDRARWTPTEQYLHGFLAGKKAAGSVDDEERAALPTATEAQIDAIVDKHFNAGPAQPGAYDPAQESAKFQEGYSEGFREACGLK